MSNWAKIARVGAQRPAPVKRKRRRKAAKPDRKLCKIYAIADEFGDIRYIGQTRIELARRFKYHMKDARGGNYGMLGAWLLEAPREIVLLDDNATWDVSEIIWIDRMRNSGLKLFNQLRGGQDTIHAVRREAKTWKSPDGLAR